MLSVAFAMTLAATSPAPAPLQPQTQTTAQPAAPAEKKICRREPVLGSNLSKKTCRTKADWSAIDRAYRDQVDRTSGMARARQSNGMTPAT